MSDEHRIIKNVSVIDPLREMFDNPETTSVPDIEVVNAWDTVTRMKSGHWLPSVDDGVEQCLGSSRYGVAFLVLRRDDPGHFDTEDDANQDPNSERVTVIDIYVYDLVELKRSIDL